MRERIPLYSTVIGFGIFILIVIGISSGIKALLYLLLIPSALLLIIKGLFKYLHEILASIITAILIIATVHIWFHVWIVTIWLGAYLFSLIIANYVIKNKKWSSIGMNTVSVIYIIILFYLVFREIM